MTLFPFARRKPPSVFLRGAYPDLPLCIVYIADGRWVVRRSGLRAVESGLFVLVWQNPLYVRLVPCGVRLALPLPFSGERRQKAA